MRLENGASVRERFAGVLPEHNGRRVELAGFLRARREELSPERLGLPMRARRRTSGLRREEVAELAGISVGLYTWLEQGREFAVSERTIDAISDALQLSAGERCHAQRLAERSTVAAGDGLTSGLQRMIAAMRDIPVLALDCVWDIVAANAASRAVFAAPPTAVTTGAVHGAHNVLDYVFLDPRARRLFLEWELAAQSMLETFRFGLAPHLEDARARTLVNRLYAASPEFAGFWNQHRIRTHPDAPCALAHPVAGLLHMETTLVTPSESPSFRLLIFAPSDQESVAKIGGMVPPGLTIA